MKSTIHPRYVDCNVICGCGATFKTISTKAEVRVEICSACHPYYTGKQKFVDTAGRVQKFEDRFKWTDDVAGELSVKVPKVRKAKVEKKLPQATIGKGAKKKISAAQTGPMTEGEAPQVAVELDPEAKAAAEAAKAAKAAAANADADLTPPGIVAAPKDVPTEG